MSNNNDLAKDLSDGAVMKSCKETADALDQVGAHMCAAAIRESQSRWAVEKFEYLELEDMCKSLNALIARLKADIKELQG